MKATKPKAVVLVSGGLDSATTLAMVTKTFNFDAYALSFSYGQKQVAELNCAKKIAKAFNVLEHKMVHLDLSAICKSALTSADIAVPDYKNDNEIPITYVPARNTIFLSMALGYAESVGAERIYLGASSVDYSGYPDCREEYFHAFNQLAQLATKVGIEGRAIEVRTPLIHLSKAETIKKGHKLGVNYQDTVTCYQASNDGLACGQCDACHLRAKGFKEAGIADPTRYL